MRFVSDKVKLEIVFAGGVAPLLKLARSRDIRVQRNATGALLNVTHLRKCLSLSLSFCLSSYLSERLHIGLFWFLP